MRPDDVNVTIIEAGCDATSYYFVLNTEKE